MFKKIAVDVIVADGITFRFAEPLSITSVTVSCPQTEEIEWELIHDAFKAAGNDIIESSFQVWQVEQAPAWALKAIEEISEREAKRIETEGPYFPTREELKYGDVPEGYREDLPAKKLVPGKYTLIIFAEQGTAAASFEVR